MPNTEGRRMYKGVSQQNEIEHHSGAVIIIFYYLSWQWIAGKTHLNSTVFQSAVITKYFFVTEHRKILKKRVDKNSKLYTAIKKYLLQCSNSTSGFKTHYIKENLKGISYMTKSMNQRHI